MDLDFSHTLVLKLIGQIHIHGGANSKLTYISWQAWYKESSNYANFITVIFQNFPEIFCLCVDWVILFHYCDFWAILGSKIALMKKISPKMNKPNSSNEMNWPKIALAKSLPNAIFGLCEFFPNFCQSQKSHKARTPFT